MKPHEYWQAIGEPFAGVVCGISLDLLVANPAEEYGDTFMVRDATIESVSKTDGRWFIVRDGGRPVRVTFKDPQYSVPTDCEGRSVMLQGVLDVKTLPEAEAKQRELTFVATGVRLSH